MRKYLMPLVFLVAATSALAELRGTPFQPEVDKRFDALEQVVAPTSYAADGLLTKRMARATYDVTGGEHSGSSTVNSGLHSLGVTLPAKSLITRSYLYVADELVDGGSGTLAIQCEDANNIKTATDMTGSSAGDSIEGESTGAASAFVGGIASDCVISAKVAGADISAGKINVFVEYVITD